MNARTLKSRSGVVAHESPRLELVREDHAPPDRPWAEAAFAGEKRVLEMIAGGHSLPAILDALCLLVEEICRGSLCSILLLDVKGERLWQGAAPSLPKSYLEAFNGREIASGWGPCGAAAFRQEQVIAADLPADPLWERYRNLVLSRGLRACWSTPVFSPTGDVMGTFALHSREPGDPAAEQRNLLEQMTHLTAAAIERQRSEEALRRSEARFEGILKIAEDGIISVN